jgi:hypothetical protein
MYMVERRNENGDIEIIEKSCPPLGLNPEAVCEAGKLVYKTGFWHTGLLDFGDGYYAHNESFLLSAKDRFYTCPCQHCCAVDASTGAIQCADGTSGLLCTLCLKGYYRNTMGTCSKCTKEDTQMSGVVVVVFCGILAMLLYWKFPTERLPQRWLYGIRSARRRAVQTAEAVRLITMIKIVVSDPPA